MIINLSPERNDDVLELFKRGDVLIVNGEEFDFSRIGEGDTLPCSAIFSKFFIGDVHRIDGELIFTITLPNPWNYSQEQAFPLPLLNVLDGIIQLPQPLSEEETVSKFSNSEISEY